MVNHTTGGATAEMEAVPPKNSGNRPTRSLILLAVLPTLAFLGIVVCAYGEVWRFFQHPARVGMVVASILLVILALFSDSSGLSSGEREDRGNRWVVPAILVL